jgi:hypothetical protein
MSISLQCGKYIVTDFCLKIRPCQHSVINTETRKEQKMSGEEILRLFDAENIKSPHFEIYRAKLNFSKKESLNYSYTF